MPNVKPPQTRDIERPAQSLIDSLKEIGSATAAGELKRLGIRNVHMQGPVSMTPGVSIVGPALTLQFMPKREDLYPDAEYVEPEQQLHRHVLYHAQKGDIVVVDARGDMSSGVFGAMMMTYFRGKGGLGIVDLTGRGPDQVVDPQKERFKLNVVKGGPSPADPVGEIDMYVSYRFVFAAKTLDTSNLRFKIITADSSII